MDSSIKGLEWSYDSRDWLLSVAGKWQTENSFDFDLRARISVNQDGAFVLSLDLPVKPSVPGERNKIFESLQEAKAAAISLMTAELKKRLNSLSDLIKAIEEF
jgi:hypothetical protein